MLTLALYLVGAVAALCAVLYAYLRYMYAYWQRRKVPYIAPVAPWGNYGPTITGKTTLADTMSDIYKQTAGERYVGTYFLHKPILQVNDPDIIKQVFIKEFPDFNGRGMHCDPENDPLSGHLFILSGQPWRNMRVKLSPTFTTGKIKYMFKTISECADYLGEHITSSMKAGGGAYDEDVRELAARFSTDIISSVAFGIESNSMKDPNSEFRRMGQSVFEPSLDVNLRTLLGFFGRGIMEKLKIRTTPKKIHEFFTRIVSEMVEYREKNNIERADVLNLLIKLKNEGFLQPDSHDNSSNGSSSEINGTKAGTLLKISEKEIAAQVFVFFVAGYETTSTTTSFTLYELAKHPEIQQKILDEIDANLKKHGDKVTYESLMDLPYMDMVIQETLRVYPPVPFLTREAMVKRQLPETNVVLEKGTSLMIPVKALHFDPQYWTDPERFDPERFTEEAKKSRHSAVYMPFGDGPRICIGMRLGLVQVKMGLMTILSKCKVSLAPSTPTKLRIHPRSIVPMPIECVKLTLTSR